MTRKGEGEEEEPGLYHKALPMDGTLGPHTAISREHYKGSRKMLHRRSTKKETMQSWLLVRLPGGANLSARGVPPQLPCNGLETGNRNREIWNLDTNSQALACMGAEGSADSGIRGRRRCLHGHQCSPGQRSNFVGRTNGR